MIFDEGSSAAHILLNLSAIFDTVSHAILLKRLFATGLRDKALTWFESFMENRTQAVQAASFYSDFKDIACGVPQGSAL